MQLDSHYEQGNEVWGTCGPPSSGGAPLIPMIYIASVDALFARALRAGAAQVRDVSDPCYGDLSGTPTDPLGHRWAIVTYIGEVSAEGAQRRVEAELAISSQD